MCACEHILCIPIEVRRGHWLSWKWNFRHWWVIWSRCREQNSGPLREQQLLLTVSLVLGANTSCTQGSLCQGSSATSKSRILARPPRRTKSQAVVSQDHDSVSTLQPGIQIPWKVSLVRFGLRPFPENESVREFSCGLPPSKSHWMQFVRMNTQEFLPCWCPDSFSCVFQCE